MERGPSTFFIVFIGFVAISLILLAIGISNADESLMIGGFVFLVLPLLPDLIKIIIKLLYYAISPFRKMGGNLRRKYEEVKEEIASKEAAEKAYADIYVKLDSPASESKPVKEAVSVSTKKRICPRCKSENFVNALYYWRANTVVRQPGRQSVLAASLAPSAPKIEKSSIGWKGFIGIGCVLMLFHLTWIPILFGVFLFTELSVFIRNIKHRKKWEKCLEELNGMSICESCGTIR